MVIFMMYMLDKSTYKNKIAKFFVIIIFAISTDLFSSIKMHDDEDLKQSPIERACSSDAKLAMAIEQQLYKVVVILNSLIDSSTSQFLADCVPVGGDGQPTDRSYGAFKIAATHAIKTRDFPKPHDSDEAIKIFCKSLTIVALDDFVGGKLQRCADTMLHDSVNLPDRTSVGFLNYIYEKLEE